jgi:sugar O-acyltransferase (sialic acid O-acetyltransferase NeuD family)
MADIVIFGASMSAEVVKTYIDVHSEHRVVGFTVDRAYASNSHFLGLPLVPWDCLEESFPPHRVELMGPISYRLMNELRRDRYYEGKARNYRFASFIHPACLHYDDPIGENCFIGPHNVIEPKAQIGDNVIIWGGSYIAHHCVIGSHTFISGEVGISGGTTIGERCFLGGGAVVGEGVSVGDACLLSMGVVVTRNIPANSVVRRSSEDRLARFPSSRVKHLL